MKKVIIIPGAPEPIGPYSPALLNNGTLYVSGQLPINPHNGKMVEGDITVLTRQVLENISALLVEAGMIFQM